MYIQLNSVITNATGPRILFDIAVIRNTRELVKHACMNIIKVKTINVTI
jgi:hypothetical protein